MARLARLCNEVRTRLPDSGFHRLRVLLDMILVDLAREGFPAEAATQPEPACEMATPMPAESA